MLLGVTGKMSTESSSDDDNFGTDKSQKTILAVLGLERRNRVLAGLYVGRWVSDCLMGWDGISSALSIRYDVE